MGKGLKEPNQDMIFLLYILMLCRSFHTFLGGPIRCARNALAVLQSTIGFLLGHTGIEYQVPTYAAVYCTRNSCFFPTNKAGYASEAFTGSSA